MEELKKLIESYGFDEKMKGLMIQIAELAYKSGQIDAFNETVANMTKITEPVGAN